MPFIFHVFSGVTLNLVLNLNDPSFHVCLCTSYIFMEIYNRHMKAKINTSFNERII